MHFSDLTISADCEACAKFRISQVDLCIVNGIRRAIMSLAPTVAIPCEENGPGGIRILRNTSVLHNEFLAHRLSLVPVHVDENQLFHYTDASPPWLFKIDVSRPKAEDAVDPEDMGVARLDVTSRDIVVLDFATGARVPDLLRDQLFPPCPKTGDHILLCTLGQGEAISIEACARRGIGQEHARWSPSSLCHLSNVIDPVAAEASLAAALAALGEGACEADRAVLRRHHDLIDRKRAFVKGEHDEPTAFDFTVRSDGRLRPTFLVMAALDVLIDKVEALRAGLAREFSRTEASSEALPHPYKMTMSDRDPGMIALSVQGEDHTLGNLVQGLLFRRWILDGEGREFEYVGYHQPHPLEKNLIFKIRPTDGRPADAEDPFQSIVRDIGWIEEHLSSLRAEWVAFAGLRELTDVGGRALAAVDRGPSATRVAESSR